MPWKRRRRGSGIRLLGRRSRRTLFFLLIAACGGVLAAMAVSGATGLLDRALYSPAMDGFFSVSPSKAAELYKNLPR